MANASQDVANAASSMANELIDNAVLSSTYRYRDSEKRRVYQREYMRAKRKKIGIAYG